MGLGSDWAAAAGGASHTAGKQRTGDCSSALDSIRGAECNALGVAGWWWVQRGEISKRAGSGPQRADPSQTRLELCMLWPRLAVVHT